MSRNLPHNDSCGSIFITDLYKRGSHHIPAVIRLPATLRAEKYTFPGFLAFFANQFRIRASTRAESFRPYSRTHHGGNFLTVARNADDSSASRVQIDSGTLRQQQR